MAVKMEYCKACGKEVEPSAKVCPSCGQKLKMGFGKKLLIGIGALIVLAIINSASKGGSTSTPTTATPLSSATSSTPIPVSTPAPTPVATVVPDPTPAPAPAPVAQWTKVASWSGSSTKNTENFTVTGSEWRIVWTCTAPSTGGIFQIYTYGKGQDLIGVAANQQGNGSDISYQHEGAGSYHLTINTMDKYTVTIEQQ